MIGCLICCWIIAHELVFVKFSLVIKQLESKQYFSYDKKDDFFLKSDGYLISFIFSENLIYINAL